MKKLILASNNAKKLKELKAILSDMDVEILSQREAGCNFEVEETEQPLPKTHTSRQKRFLTRPVRLPLPMIPDSWWTP